MRPSHLLDYIRNLAHAFYRSILKLSINAHQLIAHWRSRTHRKEVVIPKSSASTSTIPSAYPVSNQAINSIQLVDQTSNNGEATTDSRQREIVSSYNNPIELSIQQPSNTPNSRKGLFSILRRLSIRNFMEYCVTALNEASSSSCSNKLDLSSCDKPVWLLGKQYELPQEANKLVDDIRSKLWITYRRNFPPIDENTRYTTDRGFGCMIRCGQMVLANALLFKNLSRNWRWSPDSLEANPEVYFKILKLFQDKEACAYSIHNIIRTGQQEGKLIGEWFGPNTIAQALKRMSMALSLNHESISNEILISIDAALDNIVVIDEIKAEFKLKREAASSPPAPNNSKTLSSATTTATTATTTEQWVPGVLFIQLRLGLSKINPLYFSALKKTFQFKSSLGIIGGRPNHALYLIGYTEDDIIYLDPHSTQQYIDFDSATSIQSTTTTFDAGDEGIPEELKTSPIDNTYHCACPERMTIERLDPSLALCFYFHTEEEFDEWCRLSEDLLIRSEQAPMFEITKSRPSGWNGADLETVLNDEFEMLG